MAWAAFRAVSVCVTWWLSPVKLASRWLSLVNASVDGGVLMRFCKSPMLAAERFEMDVQSDVTDATEKPSMVADLRMENEE